MSENEKLNPDERLIAAIDLLSARLNRVADALEAVAEHVHAPSPGWRRLLDEFKGAVARIPTSVRMRY